MPHNEDVPFDFPERLADPTGRVIRTVAANNVPVRPSRSRRRAVDPDDPGLPLTELLKLTIREVTEREIRAAQSETDLTRLLVLSIADIERRKAGKV